MSYNTKNYTMQGGEETHFGGKVVFEDGCIVEGLPTPKIPDAGLDTRGLVKQGIAVAEATGANPTAAEFKALLDSLRNAGIIATSKILEPKAEVFEKAEEAEKPEDEPSDTEEEKDE